MGYCLEIGEADIEYVTDTEDPICSIIVVKQCHKNAPTPYGDADDMGRTNDRCPSYNGWAKFCKFAGIEHIFSNVHDGRSLIAEHPGVVPLIPWHKEEIDEAYAAYMEKHPNAIATYGMIKRDEFFDPYNPMENVWLCDLEWLRYWIDWSLKNCKRPIFSNY